ncbi:hypothetical protein [Haloglomus halophilum]|uniref:hypothetical protein n=1 Tax=Haloglomus halophilum TaxID=2962672 RepID=UPI0020C9DB14|nr:hypothetical protein [Haloglomus halophilum]
MPGDTLVIGGPSGGTSTFLGGLRHHVDKQDGLSLVSNVGGDTQSYELTVEELFTRREYPAARTGGYVVSYDLQGRTFARPETVVSSVLPSGSTQQRLWDPPGDRPLLARIRSGAAPDPETVRERYENDIGPEFERGFSPAAVEDWETVLLHHYYTADRVVFLLNLHTVVDRVDLNLAYDVDDIEHAAEQFESVAVVPTAVDLVGYDPDEAGDDGGILRQVATQVFSSGIRDEQLLERLNEVLNAGTARRTTNLLHYAASDQTVDFFGVAVPDEGSPQEQTGNLTPDGEGGFEVQGFGTVIEWLER